MADGPPDRAFAADPSRGEQPNGPPDYFTLSVAPDTPAAAAVASPERAEPVVPPDHPWAAMLAPPALGGRTPNAPAMPRTPLNLPRTPLTLPRTPGAVPSTTGAQAPNDAPRASSAFLGVPGMPAAPAPPAVPAVPAAPVASPTLEAPRPSPGVPSFFPTVPHGAEKRPSSAPNLSIPTLRLPGQGGAVPSGAALPQGALAARRPQSRSPSPNIPELASGRIQSLTAADLVERLQAEDPVLVVDIRPATAFARGHISDSVNLCAPSTLLKRKEFTLERLETQMLDPGAERERFAAWRTHAANAWVIVLDTDAVSATSMGRSTSGGGGPCLVGLLCKFAQEEYPGHLCWLHGGFSAFQALVEAKPYIVRDEVQAVRAQSLPVSPEIVRPRGLSLEAFRLPTCDAQAPAQAANPFFDNIRQNLELSCGITDVVPLEPGELSDAQKARLPAFLQSLLALPSKKRAEHLAELFFRIEKSEQERLQGVMRRHSHNDTRIDTAQLSTRAAHPQTPTEREVPQDGGFPLSITAALERGMDNRYRNLWTFEHSRVKLSHPLDPNDPGSNYVNASFVNPLRHRGSHRVSIATQAPLPVTFLAFWEAIWEQNTHVIVMLAREFEAGRLQCHNYWTFASPKLSVEVEREETLTRADLGLAGDAPIALHRVLVVRRDDATRRVHQFQYLGWPDHSVPDSADELLALSARAEAARGAHDGPIVVHCSAGIGRTGTQIIIDTVLYYLQRVQARLDAAEQGKADRDASEVREARDVWYGTTDIIFEALSVMREQRMSVVQTVRQYVFIYLAVIHALAGSCT
ncbi:hypothetical protein CBS9595_003656 [Malassezia furfur]|nr:hypothetical protein CBS9595_003656 [Malassezia furfur]